MRTRGKKDFSKNWVQTITSVVALVFVVLVGFNVITAEQSAEAQPIVGGLIGAVSTIVAGVVALIGIFFKNTEDAPVL